MGLIYQSTLVIAMASLLGMLIIFPLKVDSFGTVSIISLKRLFIGVIWFV